MNLVGDHRCSCCMMTLGFSRLQWTVIIRQWRSTACEACIADRATEAIVTWRLNWKYVHRTGRLCRVSTGCRRKSTTLTQLDCRRWLSKRIRTSSVCTNTIQLKRVPQRSTSAFTTALKTSSNPIHTPHYTLSVSFIPCPVEDAYSAYEIQKPV